MGFSRREYWSGLPFPPPGDLPEPGTEPVSPVSPAPQAILYRLSLHKDDLQICKVFHVFCFLIKTTHIKCASLVAQTVKRLPAMQETWFDPCVRNIPWRREPNPVFLPGEFHGQKILKG